ncbi:MAG: protein BatD, partial [Pseudomonadaceae bacterium]|nr:protein BatD [Pseudomonadaceae bacterium]
MTVFFKISGLKFLNGCFLLLLLLLLASPAQAVLLTPSQPKLAAGGQLEILVETMNNQAQQPALVLPASWQTHFKLLDQIYQLETKGQNRFTHRWFLVLQHLQPDSISRRLDLEPLQINGRSSQALQLLIEAARKKPTIQTQRLSQPLTMQQSVDFTDAYLGQTLVYQLLIRYQGFPLEPRLSPLEVEGATTRQLGDGREQGFNQRGVSWQEARWQELIQLHTAEARILPRYFSSRLTLTGQTGGKLYEAETPTLKINVRPIPDSWPKEQPWLPALGVNLEAAFLPRPKQLKQTEALELSIHLDVVGQQARNLPQFKAMASENWRIEPLTEELTDRIVDGLLVGSLKQRLLLYPKQAGNLKLPNLTLNWWDVNAHQARHSQVKLGQLEVLPSDQTMAKMKAMQEFKDAQALEKKQA